jgi:hypothetical protein
MISRIQISGALATLLLVVHDVAAQATVTATRTISMPTSRPTDAYNVPADFPSVGFESSFLPGYDNDFSDNLVASLASRMGAAPVIRVGGTSGFVPIAFNRSSS